MCQAAEDLRPHRQNFMAGTTSHIGHEPNPTCVVFQAGVVETLFGGKSEAIRQNTVQMAAAEMTAWRTRKFDRSSEVKNSKREPLSCPGKPPLTARKELSNSH